MNYQTIEEHRKRGTTTEAELAEAERKLLKAKIVYCTFIIDNWVHFYNEPETVAQAREELLGCYQRLYELAKLDHERIQQHAARGIATGVELRAAQQKVIEAEIVVLNFQLQEERRKSLPVDSQKASTFSPAEQQRLKQLYQQIVVQENANLQMVQSYYQAGDPRGSMLMLTEAKRGVTQAKIDLSTFLLNETTLTLSEYTRERQNLRSLYTELCVIAQEGVQAAREAYLVQRMDYAEVARYERKLTEAEIALIRLFPERDSR